MKVLEDMVCPGTTAAASALAEIAGEEFVLAVTAAYMAGLEKGKAAAQGAA